MAAAPLLPVRLASPDRHIEVAFTLSADGDPRYSVLLSGKTVLNESRLGLVRKDADFSRALKLVNVSPEHTYHDEYELLTIKRRHNVYDANQRTIELETADGKKIQIQFSVSNDGVAFRYQFPENNTAVHYIQSEASSFNFPADTHAWLEAATRPLRA